MAFAFKVSLRNNLLYISSDWLSQESTETPIIISWSTKPTQYLACNLKKEITGN